MSKIKIDESKCVGCGACVNLCEEGLLKLENNKAVTQKEQCADCDNCAEVCPFGAIEIIKD